MDGSVEDEARDTVVLSNRVEKLFVNELPSTVTIERKLPNICDTRPYVPPGPGLQIKYIGDTVTARSISVW
jgi:hypothetical protein